MCAGLARLGFVADLLSRSVLVGYLAGVALIMIAGQLGRVTGVPVNGSTFVAELVSSAQGMDAWQPATVALASGGLLFLFVVRWRWPQAPGPLLAMLLATGAVAAFGLTSHGVSVVGPVPGRLPVPQLPDVHWHQLRELLLPAVQRDDRGVHR